MPGTQRSNDTHVEQVSRCRLVQQLPLIALLLSDSINIRNTQERLKVPGRGRLSPAVGEATVPHSFQTHEKEGPFQVLCPANSQQADLKLNYEARKVCLWCRRVSHFSDPCHLRALLYHLATL